VVRPDPVTGVYLVIGTSLCQVVGDREVPILKQSLLQGMSPEAATSTKPTLPRPTGIGGAGFVVGGAWVGHVVVLGGRVYAARLESCLELSPVVGEPVGRQSDRGEVIHVRYVL
jgi:hypothetical protein